MKMSFPAPNASGSFDPQVPAALSGAVSSLFGASPAQAWWDWSWHLAASPAKRLELIELAARQGAQLAAHASQCLQLNGAVEASLRECHFAAPQWRRWPFNLWQQGFLLQQQWWWHAATHGVSGVDRHHEELIGFIARQWLEMLSPANQLATNPVVLQRTLDEGGANLLRGAAALAKKLAELAGNAAPGGVAQFVAGRDVAVMPGKIVLHKTN